MQKQDMEINLILMPLLMRGKEKSDIKFLRIAI